MTYRCQHCHTTFESDYDVTSDGDFICPCCGEIVDVDVEDD